MFIQSHREKSDDRDDPSVSESQQAEVTVVLKIP